MRFHLTWTDDLPGALYRVYRNGALVQTSHDRVFTDVAPDAAENLYEIESSHGGEPGRIGYNTATGLAIDTGPSSSRILITLSPIPGAQ